MSGLLELLLQAQNPSTQAAAEAKLKQAEDASFPQYVVELSKVLSNPAAPVSSRALSGVLLKLALSGQSEAFQARKADRWVNSVPPDQRQECKNACLQALKLKELDISRAAAQAVAAIAHIELPLNQWPDVIAKLTDSAKEPGLAPDQKVASLQAIGYICEAVEVGVIPPNQVNEILNTISSAMNDDQPEKLYLAGTTAMLNTLEFASHNMKNQAERNVILGMIVKATRSKYESVRVKGYECIVRTASNYYEFLGEYMNGLYESTFNAVQNDSEPVAMQALEFWTSLAEEELYMLEEAFEDPESKAAAKCEHYMTKVGKQLCDLLLNHCLIKQDENHDEDTRNLATAGAMCLAYLSQNLKDAILPLVLPFVERNINNEDWRRREAAVLSFGAMLEGPRPEIIQTPLNTGFETVLSKMLKQYEPNIMVRDTAAWAISMVCADHIGLLDGARHLDLLIKALLQGMDDEARVARNVAFAINNFAKAFAPFAEEATNKLSPLFQHFVSKLLLVTLRDDRTEWELAQNCYEAINSLVEGAALDVHPLILKILEEIINRLEISVNTSPNTSDEKEERDQLQMYLCGNIQVMVIKLGSEILPRSPDGQINMICADKIMELMIKLLKVTNAPCHSDCFMVAGAVANAVEINFTRYLPLLMDYIVQGLNNKEEYQVCQNAVGTVGDICRAVETGFDPFANKIMEILHHNLKDEHLNRDVKPPTLAVFGDIALAIGPKFERFMAESMATIFAAASTTMKRGQTEDEDMIEYINILRENILEALTGIIQGINGDADRGIVSRKESLAPYADPVLHFISAVATEVRNENENVSPAVLKGAVGVLGDLCFVLGQPVKEKIMSAKQFVEPLFAQCKKSSDKAAVQTAQWAAQICGISS